MTTEAIDLLTAALTARAEAAEAQARVAQDREQNADLLERERSITNRLSERLDALERHNAALIATGNLLSEGYATHDDDCPYPFEAIVTDDACTCGLNGARDVWRAAVEATDGE